MKKTIVFLLAILFLLSSLISCASLQAEMAGSILEAYGAEVPDDLEEMYQKEWDHFYELLSQLPEILALLFAEENSSAELPSSAYPPLPGITMTTIPKEKIARTESLSMSEFHPFLGLTNAMLTLDDGADGMLQEDKMTGFATPVHPGLDAFSFFVTWLDSSTEITHLRATTSVDGQINIDYGSSIELNKSGKYTTLSVLLVQQYFSRQPTILFTCGKKADECLREWFNLTGDGRYSMELDFGQVYVGDPGYRLVIENGTVYQYPLIHKDTTMNVYFKPTGEKKAELVFDAAKILRNTKIKMDDDEAEKVLNRLREYGYID